MTKPHSLVNFIFKKLVPIVEWFHWRHKKFTLHRHPVTASRSSGERSVRKLHLCFFLVFLHQVVPESVGKQDILHQQRVFVMRSLFVFFCDRCCRPIHTELEQSHWPPLTQRQFLLQHRHSYMAMLSRHCKNLHIHVFKYHHDTDTDTDMDFAVDSMMLQTATSIWIWWLLTCFFFASRAAWSEAWTVAFLNSTSRAFSISSCMRISSYARVLYNLRSTSFCLPYN